MHVWKPLVLAFTLATTVLTIVICKTYIRTVLTWLEDQNSLVMSVTICLLYVLVSLPISVGYVVLVLASGYLFGILRGMLLTVVGASVGLVVAHGILRLMRHHRFVRGYTENETAKAILRVISGPLSFKIVFCSRLTPIPFGLQNTVFALSSVNAKTYHLATMLGLLGPQFIAVYIGSTLRSMTDVIESQQIGSTTYVFIAAQLVLGAGLMVWFSTKARKELVRALADAEKFQTATPKERNGGAHPVFDV